MDEAWSLMQQANNIPTLFELVKTARKFKLGIIMITQEIGDLVVNQAGLALLANTAWKVILRQETSTIQQVHQLLNLSEMEQKKVTQLNQGEGLLIKGQEHIMIEVVASNYEKLLINKNNNNS